MCVAFPKSHSGSAVKPGLGPGASVLWVLGYLGERGQSLGLCEPQQASGAAGSWQRLQASLWAHLHTTALSAVSSERSCPSVP